MIKKDNHSSGIDPFLIIQGLCTLLAANWLRLVLMDVFKLDKIAMLASSILLIVGFVELISGIFVNKISGGRYPFMRTYILIVCLTLTALLILPVGFLMVAAVSGPPS